MMTQRGISRAYTTILPTSQMLSPRSRGRSFDTNSASSTLTNRFENTVDNFSTYGVGVEGLRVRIADFGQVGDGASAGTELYLAPELYCAISGTLQATEHASNDASGGDSMNGEDSPDLDRNFIIRDKSFPEFVPTKPKSTQATDIYSLGISFLVLLLTMKSLPQLLLTSVLV